MAIQCNIIYNEDNTVNYVQTENGERSLLFDNLVQTVGDKQKALELYALTESEDFKTINYDRISQRQKQEGNRGGEIATESTNFLRRESGSNEKNSSELQKIILEEFSKNNSNWIENYKKLGEFIGKGMESEVYLSSDGKDVYKINDLEFYDTPLDFLNTIDKHNELFPEAPYEVIGFTKRQDNNNFSFVIKQPFIQAERGATEDEVYDELTKLGFTSGISKLVYNKDNIEILDLHEGNVVVDKEGNLFFIDPVIFIEEVSVEPTVEDVMLYATSTQKELTTEQKIDLQDVIMSLGVDNSVDAEDLLSRALERNGVITFNKNRMISSGAFNTFEAEAILNSLDKQKEIKEVFKALKNTDLIEVEYPKDFVYTEGVELNSFGKQKIKNPYILQQEIVNVQETPEGIKDIPELYEGVRNIPQKAIVGGELADKTTGTDTAQILKNTLIDDENPRLAENLNFITEGFSANVWESKKESVAKIVEQIKEDAKDNGIDLKNIEEKVFTRTRQEIIDFFNSMEDMLESGDVENFAVLYNDMFDLNTPLTPAIKTDSKFDVVLEDNISEYEAFSKYGLLKKSPNIYRKVDDIPLERMYEITAINEGKTVEEVKKEIQENPLDVSDFEVDVNTLEKMQLYKNYFNFPREFSNISEDIQSEEYMRDANKWLLKTQNSYFKMTAKGLELISEDPITKDRANLTLPQNLKPEIEVETVERDINEDKRKEAYNNPLSVPKLKSDYLYIDDLVIAVKNSVDGFIRTPRGVFELIYNNDNVAFYGLLESASEKPLSDINFKEFDYLINSPESFKTPKNYYSKAELEEINSENFNC